jgi:hypothetical protein
MECGKISEVGYTGYCEECMDKMRIYEVKENWDYCKGCGRWEDLRYGYCFDCATIAEQLSELNSDGMDQI